MPIEDLVIDLIEEKRAHLNVANRTAEPMMHLHRHLPNQAIWQFGYQAQRCSDCLEMPNPAFHLPNPPIWQSDAIISGQASNDLSKILSKIQPLAERGYHRRDISTEILLIRQLVNQAP